MPGTMPGDPFLEDPGARNQPWIPTGVSPTIGPDGSYRFGDSTFPSWFFGTSGNFSSSAGTGPGGGSVNAQPTQWATVGGQTIPIQPGVTTTTLGGAGAASGAWYQNPEIWQTAAGALLGGYGSYNQAQQGGGTSSQSSQTTPWGPIAPDLEAILAAARQQFGTPINYRTGGGGGGGNVASSETQALLALLGQQARGGTPLLNAANSAAIGGLGDPYAGNALTGQWNDLLQQSMTPGRAGDAIYSLLGAGTPGYTPGVGYDARTGGPGGGSGGSNFAGFAGGGGGAGGAIGPSIYDEYIRQYLDLGENPHTQEMIDNFQREAEEDYLRSLGPATGALESAGRLGSGFHQQVLSLLGEEYNEANQAQIAQLLAGDLSERRQLGLGALGIQNTRDISGAEIAAQRDATSAAAGAAASSTQLQRDLGMRGLDIEEMLGLRGQNLGALGGLLGFEQNVLGMGTGLAGQLGSQQLGLMSLIPGLSEAGFGAMDRALPANLQLDQMRGQERSRAQQNAVRQQMEPGQRLDDYMRRILGLSDRFSPTQGEARQPSPYGDPTTAAVLGLLGGGLAAWGASSRN